LVQQQEALVEALVVLVAEAVLVAEVHQEILKALGDVNHENY
jgi:hypothetical protein